MTEYLDLSVLEVVMALPMPAQPVLRQPTQKTLSEVSSTSPATFHGGDANSSLPLWKPAEPQFTKAIAHYYGVSRKSVQQWFQKVKDACPWFTEANLKLPDGRYTRLCIELMGSYRTCGLPFEAWKTQLWKQNPELVLTYQTACSQKPATAAAVSTSITVQAVDLPLAGHDVSSPHPLVSDSAQQLIDAITNLNTTLQKLVSNDQILEALNRNAAHKGPQGDSALAIAEIGMWHE